MTSRLRQQKRREKAQRKRQGRHPRTMDEFNAMHESFHTVAAIFAGCDIQYVSLATVPPETSACTPDDRAAAIYSMGPAVGTLKAYGHIQGCFGDIAQAVAHADDAGIEAWQVWSAAEKIIHENWDIVLLIARLLMEHRHITGEDLASMLDDAAA